MKAIYLRQYTSKNGNTVFVYTLSLTADQLAEYQAAQGEYYREDDKGRPLWFSSRFIGNSGKLIITATGQVRADMSELAKQKSLVEQAGGDFGAALAAAAAQNFLGGSPTPTAPASPEETPEESPQEDELEPEG